VLPFRFKKLLANNDGAFAKLEAGQISAEQFAKNFEEECRKAGATNPNISGEELIRRIQVSLKPRKEMINTIVELREKGLKTATITNNWRYEHPKERHFNDSTYDLFRQKDSTFQLSRYFDVIVESYKVGIRKPDPLIYELAVHQLRVKANECIFLDDLGINLKPARQLGMFTIKVDMYDYVKALYELQEELGFELNSLKLTAKL
jgi:epoxide hydrolase-like predicted phosphatase